MKKKISPTLLTCNFLQLEMEVATLKSRLDGLRKAKNTTIIRREREEIRISSPNLGKHRPSPATPTATPTSSHYQLEQVKELKSQVIIAREVVCVANQTVILSSISIL